MQFLGPLAGNYLIAQLGLKAGFLVSAGMFALLAVLGWQVLPEQAAPKRSAARGRLLDLLRLPAVRTTYGFEMLASFTASSVGVFSILLAIRVLHWPRQHAVWLMAVQGLSLVVVLLGLGKAVLASPQRQRFYGVAHLAIMAALLLLGLWPTSGAYLAASLLLGVGLGVNSLVNTDRIAHAAVDKAQVSAHLTLLNMLGGSVGALAAGRLADSFGLQRVFLLWLVPWLTAAMIYHLRPQPVPALPAGSLPDRETDP
jgi:predicted MFS family arabinose efflux permease